MNAQALKHKVASLVAAVSKRNIMQALKAGNYQGNAVMASLRRFLRYLHKMRHVCFNKSIADPDKAAADAAKAAKAASEKAAAAQATAEARGHEVALVEEGPEPEEPRFTLQEVRELHACLLRRFSR